MVLRCLNNLDERFHHSFFLYLMTAADRFVPVELYIIPLVALIGVLVLKVGRRMCIFQQWVVYLCQLLMAYIGMLVAAAVLKVG